MRHRFIKKKNVFTQKQLDNENNKLQICEFHKQIINISLSINEYG